VTKTHLEKIFWPEAGFTKRDLLHGRWWRPTAPGSSCSICWWMSAGDPS
jgi:hypothetical protein